MLNRLVLTACILSVSMLSGCKSSQPSAEFQETLSQLTVITEPSGADVYAVEPLTSVRTHLGRTPLHDASVLVIHELTFHNMDSAPANVLASHLGGVGILIQKEGYRDYRGILSVPPGTSAEHTITLEPIHESQ